MSVAVGAHLHRESAPSLGDPRLDGAERNVELGGDVGVLEIADIAEEDRVGVEIADDGRRLHQIEARAGDHAGAAVLGQLCDRVAVELFVLCSEPSVGVARSVRRDLVHPGSEARSAFEAGDPAGDREQGVLGRVLGISGVGEEPTADPLDVVANHGQQLVERTLVVDGPAGEWVEVRPGCDHGVMDRIGRYVIERRLGTGAFATVWLGFDEALDAHVAIKVLADNWAHDADVRSRFTAEARWLWRADDPRIVRVFTVGELDNGQPYFVMEHADRGSLADRIDGPIDDRDRAVGLVEAMAACIGAVHEAGAIHRDVKPANFLVSSDRRGVPATAGLADDERLLIVDLGLAKELATASGFTLSSGSSGYMAPEQREISAGLDARADLFALGVVTYELLAGTSPLSKAGDVVRLIVDDRPDLPGETAAALDRFFARALSPEPSGRHDDAPTFASEFRSAMHASAAAWRPPAPETRLAPSTTHGREAAAGSVEAAPAPDVTTIDRPAASVAPLDPTSEGAPSGGSMPRDRLIAMVAAGALVIVGVIAGAWALTRPDSVAGSATATSVATTTAPPASLPDATDSTSPAATPGIASEDAQPFDTLSELLPFATPAEMPEWFPLAADVPIASVTTGAGRIRVITEPLDDAAGVCADLATALAAQQFSILAWCPVGAAFDTQSSRAVEVVAVGRSLGFDLAIDDG